MTKSKKLLLAKESNSTTNNSPDGINGIRGINNTAAGKDMIWVDPMHVRFQHSKIRPVFSSCGRTLMETLNSIRNNEITPAHLPPIQVRTYLRCILLLQLRLIFDETWHYSLF